MRNSSSSSSSYQKVGDSPRSYAGDFDFGQETDRRFAFSRQPSFHQNSKPLFTRSVSSIDIPPPNNSESIDDDRVSPSSLFLLAWRSGNKQIRRLFLLISLNVLYSTAELLIGLFSGRIGLVSDAFHLTFGCGLLSFSLFAMAASRQKADRAYTYGFKRLEVLAAFTNATAVSFVYVILLSSGSTSCIHPR